MEEAKRWAVAAQAQTRLDHPTSIHISDLLGRQGSLTEVIRAFASLASTVNLDRFICICVIPLGMSETLVCHAPKGELKDGYDAVDEPASLYIVDARAARAPLESEEYRVPVAPLLEVPGCTLSSYYRCFRNSEAQMRGWEFQRAIYIEANPTLPSGVAR